MTKGGSALFPALGPRLMRSLGTLAIVVLLGGFAAAALVRYGPGFCTDENAWNPQYSASSEEATRRRCEDENNLPQFYLRYLRGAVEGNFGTSKSYGVPVRELIESRVPITAGLVAFGVGGGVLLAGLFAWIAVWSRMPAVEAGVSGVVAVLLAVPPAVLALGFFLQEAPIQFAVSLTVLARIFGTVRTMLHDAYGSSPLLAARARGLGPIALGWRYVLRPLAPRILALFGVAVMIAFGALVPIEALCDVPGIGQLAWKAAVSRDLPLLSALSLIITFLVASIHSLGEVLAGRTSRDSEAAV